MKMLDVVIVGAGAAGVGMAAVLRDLNIERYIVLERGEKVGASFSRWSKGMRFITPSFPSNSFGAIDLNSVTLKTSPAYSLKTEHPTGEEYAKYLQAISNLYELHIETNIEVESIKPLSNGFSIKTNRDVEIPARFVIWAAGEFQFPRTNGFDGAEHCKHNSLINDWSEIEGDNAIIIGGYESGIDAAYNLSRLGKKVRVIDQRATWESEDSDPSISLSPYTLERLRTIKDDVELIGEVKVSSVEKRNGHFIVHGKKGRKKVKYETKARPILATGFSNSLKQTPIGDLFDWHEEHNYALLTEQDESTKTQGLFLSGPFVRHEDVIFCFIYKFRQRFAVIANEIATRMKIDTSPLEEYRRRGMFLDDPSCCREQCTSC
jgi:thioredoxin reductase